jgi:hypothetical protein
MAMISLFLAVMAAYSRRSQGQVQRENRSRARPPLCETALARRQMRLRRSLLPFNGSRRLGRDVVDDAVYAAHFVEYAVGDLANEFIR